MNSYRGILLCDAEKQSIGTDDHTDELQKYYADLKEPDTEINTV